MVTIVMTKDSRDPRKRRSKILKKGCEITCTKEIAKAFFEKKIAKKKVEDMQPRRDLVTVEEAVDYEKK